MEQLLAVALGLGLAAASGLRVFVPMLALGIGAASGRVHLAGGWEWIGSTTAIVAFGVAAILEVVAYAVPWLDHALDVVATPAAVVAGMVASASVLMDVPPLVKWVIVIVGGGGLAGLAQGTTVVTRAKSGILTGGLANPVVSVTELLGALVVSVMALLLPIVTLVLLVLLLLYVFRRAGRLLFGRHAVPSAPGGRATPP